MRYARSFHTKVKKVYPRPPRASHREIDVSAPTRFEKNKRYHAVDEYTLRLNAAAAVADLENGATVGSPPPATTSRDAAPAPDGTALLMALRAPEPVALTYDAGDGEGDIQVESVAGCFPVEVR